MARAWTAWDQFFGFLVADEVVVGNPMAAVAKPKVPRGRPKALQGEGTPERLPATEEGVPLRNVAPTDK